MFGVRPKEFDAHVYGCQEAMRRQRQINEANSSRVNILASSVEELRRRVNEAEARLREKELGDEEGAVWSLDIEERVCRIERALAALVGLLSQQEPTQ